MKPIKTTVALAAMIMLSAVASVAGADEKTVLKSKYTPGTYLATTKAVTDQTITANNMQQPSQHIEQLMVMKLSITEPDEEGSKRIEMTYERFKQQIKVGQQIISYDSAGPAEEQHPMLARTLSVLTKAKIEVTVDKDDNITKVSGLDDLWDELAGQNEQMKPMAQKMKSQLGDAMIKRMFEQNTAMLPADPVGVGEKWQNEMELDLPFIGKVKTSLACKLDSVNKDAGATIASISWTGSITADSASETAVGEVNMTVDKLKLDQTGSASFDVDKGMVTSVVVTQAGGIDLRASGPDGQTVPLRINQKAKMETSVEPYVPKEETPSTEGKSSG